MIQGNLGLTGFDVRVEDSGSRESRLGSDHERNRFGSLNTEAGSPSTRLRIRPGRTDEGAGDGQL